MRNSIHSNISRLLTKDFSLMSVEKFILDQTTNFHEFGGTMDIDTLSKPVRWKWKHYNLMYYQTYRSMYDAIEVCNVTAKSKMDLCFTCLYVYNLKKKNTNRKRLINKKNKLSNKIVFSVFGMQPIIISMITNDFNHRNLPFPFTQWIYYEIFFSEDWKSDWGSMA